MIRCLILYYGGNGTKKKKTQTTKYRKLEHIGQPAKKRKVEFDRKDLLTDSEKGVQKHLSE